MALHSAQGPRLGVPQMMQTRGQFGSYGSLIVIVLVVVMYVGDSGPLLTGRRPALYTALAT